MAEKTKTPDLLNPKTRRFIGTIEETPRDYVDLRDFERLKAAYLTLQDDNRELVEIALNEKLPLSSQIVTRTERSDGKTVRVEVRITWEPSTYTLSAECRAVDTPWSFAAPPPPWSGPRVTPPAPALPVPAATAKLTDAVRRNRMVVYTRENAFPNLFPVGTTSLTDD